MRFEVIAAVKILIVIFCVMDMKVSEQPAATIFSVVNITTSYRKPRVEPAHETSCM
jgi:hypothetical protein